MEFAIHQTSLRSHTILCNPNYFIKKKTNKTMLSKRDEKLIDIYDTRREIRMSISYNDTIVTEPYHALQ